jgi:hypothetical protein
LRSTEIVVWKDTSRTINEKLLENITNLKNTYKLMVWKSESKRHIAMRRRRGEDNIKIVLIAMGFALWTG